MLFEKNEVIKIEQDALFADVVAEPTISLNKFSDSNESVQHYRIDAFKTENGLAVLRTKTDVAFRDQLPPLKKVFFAETERFETDDCQEILRKTWALKSQVLLKYFYDRSPWLFTVLSKHGIDLKEPVGIVKSIPAQNQYYLANGIDVLLAFGGGDYRSNLISRPFGCYLSKKELVYVGATELVVAVEELSLQHINMINRFLKEDGYYLNLELIEDFLDRKIKNLPFHSTLKELPTVKGTTTSLHNIKAVIDSVQHDFKIHAELLDAITLNNRKYRLYHNGASYLLTHYDDAVDEIGFRLNFGYLEFEQLNYFQGTEINSQPYDVRVALQKMIADKGVDLDIPLADNIPLTAFVDRKIKTITMQNAEDVEYSIQVAGELLKSVKTDVIEMALYGTKRSAVLVTLRNFKHTTRFEWSRSLKMNDMIKFADDYLGLEMPVEVKRKHVIEFIEALVKNGFCSKVAI